MSQAVGKKAATVAADTVEILRAIETVDITVIKYTKSAKYKIRTFYTLYIQLIELSKYQ